VIQTEKLVGDAYAYDLRATRDQERLTAEEVLPRMDEVLQRLKELRAAVDAGFQPKVEAVRNQRDRGEYGFLSLARYPFGFCREIRDRVVARMVADPFFQELVGKGLVLRKVFIFLRAQYFQNAIQLGNLYLDPANDTVVVTKPKIEWAPIAELDYENVESWSQFAEVSERYLRVRLYPNLVFPMAFPVAPFFAVHCSGRIDLLQAQGRTFSKDLNEGMTRCSDLLENEQWMNRSLPEPFRRLVEESCGSNLYEAFPLEYRPTTPSGIRESILDEFRTLLTKPSSETLPVLKGYLEVVQKAVTQLRMKNLILEPELVEQLRADGCIPERGDVDVGINLD
tara:strand:+ start:54 stop:1070 length:1017 start_codon:yes stop_codon:yes gene_type:complete